MIVAACPYFEEETKKDKLRVAEFERLEDVPEGWSVVNPNDLHKALGYPHQGEQQQQRYFRQESARRHVKAWAEASRLCRPRSEIKRRLTYGLSVQPKSACDFHVNPSLLPEERDLALRLRGIHP